MFTRKIQSLIVRESIKVARCRTETSLPFPHQSKAALCTVIFRPSILVTHRPSHNSRAITRESPCRFFSTIYSEDKDSKFALPDNVKEKELSTLQVEVQDRYRNGDYRGALKLSRDLLKDTEDHFGTDHPVTASAYNNIGLLHKQLGNFDDSRKSYKEALKIYKKVVGTEHASYASILHNMGNLNRSQIQFDGDLKATDRLTLLEQAAKYLEEAYQVRVAEMGPDHPHTVASRSSWGSTIAAQILHHYKVATKANTGRKAYIPLLSMEVTLDAWEAAETHLREALQTAIDKPRGTSLQQAKGKRNKKSKKNRQQDVESSESKSSIQTLSAAAAAQNLAVVLKTRATAEKEKSEKNEEWLAEAKRRYEEALFVRSKLLPKGHPDLYATKFSLAELLAAMGDEEAANVIRQEIIDTYDPPEKDGEASSTESEENEESTETTDSEENEESTETKTMEK